MPSTIEYMPGPIERVASPYAERRWYCVAYSDGSCVHIHSRSGRHARDAAAAGSLPWASRPTVTPDTCNRTGQLLPVIRR